MDPLAPLITALHAEGRLRVWSLVITVFGDSVQNRGGQISTTRLGRLLGRVGVEPGAIRTALSRLARDGWVAGERSGRTSDYRLTADGLLRFIAATERIYAAPQTEPVQFWTLSLDDGETEGFALGPLRLRPAGVALPDAAFRLQGRITALSPVVRASLIAPAYRLALDRLYADLAVLDLLSADRPEPGGMAGLSPLDACAARILLIHRWRRIALRHPDLPADLLPPDLPLPPRVALAHAYARLTPLAESWLDSEAADMPAMPPSDATLALRFTKPS